MTLRNRGYSHLCEWLTIPLKSLNLKLLEASLIRVINASFSRNLLRLTLLLTTDQNCSIGLSSGEYEGRPSAEIAPKMVVVVARVLGTVTTAGVPFLDHAILRFKLIWKADSSRKTQFLFVQDN
ncbi:hypothetical protein G6F63_013306 [Rhizopus arrhizus]|nr:hypothetical protein G6F23_012955 [Rhizopus arrhizus]KAG0898000.1 hypothetical protein G6F33_013382 [Rhizopus arrhizus]KAG0925775.1 hypothetical protein G6F32_013441 [Rhizopus arrhizus]KAG1154508.1 hypothetical protein G6F36_014473 [Rhizopus arrhizus]KAG1253372.1 hypothetical protein G6F65_017495 [Rhizopus arrhizus]